ncbi:MAG: hypothetical protein ACREEL_09560 [Stellaceae bacterium]
MAGSIQSLLIVGLVSAGGLAIRLLSLFGPVPVAWAITIAVGVVTFAAASVLLGIGLAVALLGLI